ncbi:MAG: COX15/CtaA family protein [Steroidobacteraceae bacterium]|jgi:cytochrome c oxidase assembly protein subunit 15
MAASGETINTVPLFVRSLVGACLLLCLGVVVLGAYVRLSNAGLGCPDWPGCYGHLTPTAAAADAEVRSAPLSGRPLELGKAWREMVHRYAAGTLGFLIVMLVLIGAMRWRDRVLPLNFVVALLAIVIAQGVLGMLTVTRQLTPLIVTLHLLFGFTTLALLLWLVLSLEGHARELRPALTEHIAARARALALVGLIALGAQIALGGWTSSNYAAAACPDFPTCQAQWWPAADFRTAFDLRGTPAPTYEGGVLDTPARTAIQFTHRLGALTITAALGVAAIAALRVRDKFAQRAAGLVIAALALQLIIGVTMVVSGFPLLLATAHSAGAALLLMATVGLNRALRAPA